MTATGPTPATTGSPLSQPEYVFDTGPLLCLGLSRSLRASVINRHYGRAHWVQAVREELLRQANGNGYRARAAQAASGRSSSWLIQCVQFSAADEADLQSIGARLRHLAARRINSSGSTHPQAHLGEAQSILHARRRGYGLVAHDRDAQNVAREHQIRACTIVTMARQLVADNGARPQDLASELLTLQQNGIDTGERIQGPLDLTPRPRRPGPLSRR